MELIIQLLMILICWLSCLKLSYAPRWLVWLYALLLGGFVFLGSDFASSQTKATIAGYIEQHSLRENITILVTLEAMVLIAFAFWELKYGGKLKMSLSARLGYWVLRSYPPLLILPTLVYLHTALLFHWTGVDFSSLSLGLAVSVVLFFALIPLGVRYILHERELRSELLCLSAFFVFVLGLITTVDHHLIYQAPEYEFPLKGFILALSLALLCFAIGYFIPHIKLLISKNR